MGCMCMYAGNSMNVCQHMRCAAVCVIWEIYCHMCAKCVLVCGVCGCVCVGVQSVYSVETGGLVHRVRGAPWPPALVPILGKDLQCQPYFYRCWPWK